MKKLVFIAPHLSTGGLPQYLLKQIESVIDEYDVYCIEWVNHTGGKLVVQRNQIEKILGNKLITLSEDKSEIVNIIRGINPDIIHFQEIPEYFMPYEITTELYNETRPYKIIETSHDSSFDINNKVHFPDRFLMVSNWQVKNFQKLGIPTELVEYPIEHKTKVKDRTTLLQELGLDPNLKHVINVGLFTPRKNQAEIVEYAKMLKDYPIQFHFIGNQADNFMHYWKPLMDQFPDNCKWWGERSDVDTFYQVADLFLFTSRGNISDTETMPLVIRESIGWNLPSLIYNLEVYENYFDKFENISYLDFYSLENNCKKIIKSLELDDFNNTIKNTVDDLFNIGFIKEENKIIFEYKKEENKYFRISIKDKDSNAPMYWFENNFSNYVNYWCIPIPLVAFNFYNEDSFREFLIEFFDENNNLVYEKNLQIKDSKNQREIKLDLINSFDCLFNNYNEMFVSKKYDCYGLDNLDIVLDIGANNGLFSLLLLNNGAKKIYAFEPNNESLINLRHMFRNESKVSIIEKAVYINDNDLEFFIDPSNTTIGSVNKQHLDINGTHCEKIVVPSISLKSFIEQNSIEKISLVKMDIEGAEYDIIYNLEDEIFDKIDSFLIEWHDNYDERIIKLIDTLKSKGYNINQIRNQNDKNNIDLTYSYSKEPVGTFLAVKAKNDELLTVVIPTYNQENYIEECIESVLSQKTLFNFKILISDDCSQDKTFELMQKYSNVSNIEIKKELVNIGGNPKRFYSIIKDINSRFITVLDGDDYYLDELKLQKQVDFLRNNTEYKIHSTGYFISKEDSILYGSDGNNPLFLKSTIDEVELQNNIESNFVGFGFMFDNSCLKTKDIPSWFFNENVFDGYWALINVVLEYGKAKNETWIGGRYRITPSGQFGEKDEDWKNKKVKLQANIHKKYLIEDKIKPILIVDAFFHDDNCYDTFEKYISFIKELNIPIMLVTNSKIKNELQDKVDYIFYDSNNRLFEQKYEHVNHIVFYYGAPSYYFSMGTPGFQKHGLSVLSNLYHTTNLAKSLGYTHFYRIEYDCFIQKIENVKQIISDVSEKNKKGLVYINENRYISYQIWYLELDWFTNFFPKINSEEDYKNYKKVFNYDRDFISAEEFVYLLIKQSNGSFENLIVKDAPEMHTDFGNCVWNSIMTPLESEKIIDGFTSSVNKITIKDGVNIPEICPVDNGRVAIVTWNCSSSKFNESKIKIKYPNGNIENIIHSISGINDHRIHFVDLLEEDIEIEIELNNKVKRKYFVSKNNVNLLDDTYQ